MLKVSRHVSSTMMTSYVFSHLKTHFCLLQVQDKFRLDMTEEEAVRFFQTLIDESVSALFAVMVEQIHKWAQVSQIHISPSAFFTFLGEDLRFLNVRTLDN